MTKRIRRRITNPIMKAMVIASWHSISRFVANDERIPHSFEISRGFFPSGFVLGAGDGENASDVELRFFIQFKSLNLLLVPHISPD